jgi:osmotically-inducible protein OsmY
MRIANFSGIIFTALALVGCSTERQSAYHSTPVYGGEVISSGPNGATMVVTGTPKSQIEADRELEENLRLQISRYGDLATTTPDVRIYAQSGTVTLSGNVPSQREREMIESLVRNQTGVVAVNDQLQVGYSPTGAVNGPVRVYTTPPNYVVGSAPAIVYSGNVNVTVQATTLADRNLGQRIVDRLRSDPSLPPLSCLISVSISAGSVYLRGTADTEEQRLAIVSIIQHTYGVSGVYDQLTLR